MHTTNATRAYNKRRQRFNCKTPAAALTHSPTIRRRQARRNHYRQFRQPGPFRPVFPQRIAQTVNDPPAWTVSAAAIRDNWATFPAFPPDICGRSRPRAPALLRACLHKYARLYEFLHICNENYIPYSTNARKALILLAFKACTLCIRRQKVFTLVKCARKALILLHLRTLHKQPICAKMTIYQYINFNLCGSML